LTRELDQAKQTTCRLRRKCPTPHASLRPDTLAATLEMRQRQRIILCFMFARLQKKTGILTDTDLGLNAFVVTCRSN
jgi:hypothetical protein